MKKIFKKVLLLFMVGTLTFSFVACGDDDEEEIKTTINEAGIDVSLLYGKWSFTNQGIVMIEMTLKKDGTGTIGRNVLEGTYSLTWVLNGDKLTLSAEIEGEIEDVVVKIVSLTQTNLVVTTEEDGESVINFERVP